METTQLSNFIKEATEKYGNDSVYSLLCRLAGTVSKQYDEEEQEMKIIEELEKWIDNPKCFNHLY